MSVLKAMTFTSVPRAHTASPEQQRREKLIAHLKEQLAIARADRDGAALSIKKRRWELTEDGRKVRVEVDKRLKRWWTQSAEGSLVLTVRWGSKPLEFERGKAGIVVGDIEGVIKTIDKLIGAIEAGELDAMIATINKQRAIARKRAA